MSGLFQVFYSHSSREEIVKKNIAVRDKVDWSKDLERSHNIPTLTGLQEALLLQFIPFC